MSGSVADLIPRGQEPELYEAEIAEDATGPADRLRCFIPELLERRLSDPCGGWQPRLEGPPLAIRLPVKGDRAVVAIVEGEGWIVAWTPADYES